MNDFAFMQQDDGKKRKGVRAGKEIKFVLCGRKGDKIRVMWQERR